MNDERNPLLAAAPAVIAIVLFLFGTYLWKNVSLEVPRSGAPARLTYQFDGTLQTVDARLWQDPFLAVDEYKNKSQPRQSQTGAVDRSKGRLNPLEKGGTDNEEDESLLTDVFIDWVRKGFEENPCESTIAARDTPLRNEPEYLSAYLRCHLAKEDWQDVTLIPILVPGGPYVGYEETRRRIRYATVTALSRFGFSPLDGEHIGFIEMPHPDSMRQNVAELVKKKWEIDKNFELPFEIFTTSGKNQTQAAVILWIDAEILRVTPLKKLSILLGNIIKPDNYGSATALTAVARKNKKKVKVRVIGPPNSTLLSEMISEYRRISPKEDDGRKNSKTGLPLACLEIEYLCGQIFYSSRATASDSALNATRKTADDGGYAQPLFPHGEFEFVRTVATDEDVARALVRELALRYGGREAEGEARHLALSRRMVLISETDTLYGRALPLEITKALGLEKACNDRPLNSHDDCPRIVSYLRGIDGVVANALGRTLEKEKNEERGKDGRFSAPSERAEGTSQLDYLRRLTWNVRDLNRSFNEASGKAQVEFVGLLGSDLNDKLAILRAMREELPGAVFFTTDLDARMLHPDQYNFARNLVVGSSAGLSLHPDLQSGLPPFRDNYQVSMFLSIALAVKESSIDPDTARRLFQPLVFEIGRTTPFDLSNNDARTCADFPSSCDSIHPPVNRNKAPVLWPVSVFLFLMLMTAAMPSVCRGWAGLIQDIKSLSLKLVRSTSRSPISRRRDDDAVTVQEGTALADSSHQWAERRRFFAEIGLRDAIICAVAFAIVGILYVIVSDARSPDGEPFSILEGVSVWPATFIRLMAFVLAVRFLFIAHVRLQRNADSIGANYFGNKESGELKQEAGEGVEKFLWRRAWRFVFLSEVKPAKLADAVWRDYMNAESAVGKWIRITICVVIFGAFCLTVIGIWGMPNLPARGETSHWINRILLFTVLLLFFYLLFLVVDASRNCATFINAISDPDLKWNMSDKNKSETKWIEGKYISRWLALRVIEQRTNAVSSLIYYPCIILLFLIFARSRLFDNWTFPPGLVLVISISFLWAIMSAFLLDRAGENARKRMIEGIEYDYLVAADPIPEGGRASPQQLKHLIERIREMREGAFRPLLDQPAWRALLLPFGSAGGLGLIEYFFLARF